MEVWRPSVDVDEARNFRLRRQLSFCFKPTLKTVLPPSRNLTYASNPFRQQCVTPNQSISQLPNCPLPKGTFAQISRCAQPGLDSWCACRAGAAQ